MWRKDKPNAGIGRLFALEYIFKEAVPDLWDSLRLAGAYAPELNFLQRFGAPNADAIVNIGDLVQLPDMDGKGWLHIRIVPGLGDTSGMDVASARAWVTGETADEFTTTCAAYLLPEAFRTVNETMQIRVRTLTMTLIQDWMRARVVNYVNQSQGKDYRTLTLPSQERWPDGILDGEGHQRTDQLSMCYGKFHMQGFFTRAFGDVVCHGVRCIHSGTLQG